MIELDHILQSFHSQAIKLFFSPPLFLASPEPTLPFTPLKLQIPFQKREHRRLECVTKYINNRKYLVMKKSTVKGKL